VQHADLRGTRERTYALLAERDIATGAWWAITFDDIVHYQKVVTALGETIRFMAEIDTAIDEYGRPLDNR
jgi:hypothetical protein